MFRQEQAKRTESREPCGAKTANCVNFPNSLAIFALWKREKCRVTPLPLHTESPAWGRVEGRVTRAALFHS